MISDISIAEIREQIASIGDLSRYKAQENLYRKTERRQRAERQRLHTGELIKAMVGNTTPQSRIAAAKRAG